MKPLPSPNPMDMSMDAAARDMPDVPLTIGAVLDVAGHAPSLSALRRHVADRISDIPSLTHHLSGPRLRGRWAHEPWPDLDQRVRERAVPGSGDLDVALDELIGLPLPQDGPPWDLWLLRGRSSDTHTLCFRAAHTAFDGIGVRNTLYALFGGTTPAAPGPERAKPADYVRAIRAQAGVLARSNVWNDPGRPLAGERLRGWVDVPTERLRGLGRPAGASSNDVALACLASALRDWGAEYWPRGAGKPLSTVVMVDGRRSHESDRPGNLFAFAPILLPCHLPGFGEQLAAVTAATGVVKQPSMRHALRTLMERTPARAYYAAARKLTDPARATVDTSHVAFHHPLGGADAPVTSVRMFTWLPLHHPLSLISCAYEGVTSLHFVSDAALPAFDDLPRRWRAALETAELRGSSPGIRR